MYKYSLARMRRGLMRIQGGRRYIGYLRICLNMLVSHDFTTKHAQTRLESC